MHFPLGKILQKSQSGGKVKFFFWFALLEHLWKNKDGIYLDRPKKNYLRLPFTAITLKSKFVEFFVVQNHWHQYNIKY